MANQLRIIFLHGFLGSGKDWQPVVDQIKSRSQFICETPSFLLNESDFNLGTSFTEFSENFNHWLKPFSSEELIFVGYSMGGRLLLHYLLSKSILYKQAFILSAHLGHLCSEQKKQRRKWSQHWLEQLERLPLVEFSQYWQEQALFKPIVGRTREPEHFDIQKLKSSLSYFSVVNHQIEMDQIKAHKQRWHWICGAEDSKYLKLYRKLADSGDILAPIVITGASHRVHLDQPQALADAMIQLLVQNH